MTTKIIRYLLWVWCCPRDFKILFQLFNFLYDIVSYQHAFILILLLKRSIDFVIRNESTVTCCRDIDNSRIIDPSFSSFRSTSLNTFPFPLTPGLWEFLIALIFTIIFFPFDGPVHSLLPQSSHPFVRDFIIDNDIGNGIPIFISNEIIKGFCLRLIELETWQRDFAIS